MMKKVSSRKRPASPISADAGFFSNKIRSALPALGTLLLVSLLFLLFMSKSFSLLSTGGESFPRGLFCLLPLIAPDVFREQWVGEISRWSFDINRLTALLTGLGLFVNLAGTGWFLWSGIKAGFRNRTSVEWGGENLFFSVILGLVFWSTLLAVLGMLGIGLRSGILSIFYFLLLPVFLPIPFGVYDRIFGKNRGEKTSAPPTRKRGRNLLVAGILLLSILYVFGGTIPFFEYDALEYHAQGAREFYEAGRIAFSDHNVYLNMPLGMEMIYLWGLAADPAPVIFRVFSDASPIPYLSLEGAKIAIGFLPLVAAIGIFAFGRRFFSSERIALFAAFCYLATPENFQVFSNGLNDGVLGLLLFGGIYALIFWRESFVSDPKVDSSEKGQGAIFLLLAGISTGFAAGCKYTAIPFVLFPAFLFVSILLFRSRETLLRKIKGILLFLLPALLSGGVWYLRNLLVTGNPFWPLGWRCFGDRTGLWDSAINTRWTTAHSAHEWGVTSFFGDFARFFGMGDFAPLFIAIFFIPLLFGVGRILWGRMGSRRLKGGDGIRSGEADDPSYPERRSDRVFLLLTGYVLFFLLLWWGATHRLSRFLVPVTPVLALLTAVTIGDLYRRLPFRPARGFLTTLLLFGGVYSLFFLSVTTNGFLVPYRELLSDPDRYGDWTVWINNHPTLSDPLKEGENQEADPLATKRPSRKLLLVGDARGFAYRFVPVLYNTCWNHSLLKDLLPRNGETSGDKLTNEVPAPSFDWTPDEILEIKENFHRSSIGWILVDYNEIRRFLSPGNYGLTDKEFMTPALFTHLIDAGILEVYPPPFPTSPHVILYRVKEP